MEKETIQRKLDATESRWEAVQLQSAMAQRELDFAVAYYTEHKEELDPTVYPDVEAQIENQKNSIKDFLMKGTASYKSDRAYLLEQLSRIEKSN